MTVHNLNKNLIENNDDQLKSKLYSLCNYLWDQRTNILSFFNLNDI